MRHNGGFTFPLLACSMAVMSIDLHIHSCFSDGAYHPSQLVGMAKLLGVEVIAIADHDSVAGIPDAISAGSDSCVEVIPAVELSVHFEDFKDVHLLGYGIDYCDELFLRQIDCFRNRREQRNREIMNRVNGLLHAEGRETIAIDEVLDFANDAIGRPHIARALMARNYVSSMEDAFQRYLVPCNVAKSYWLIQSAIDEIHRIGGAAVLAHPTSISRDQAELKRVISALKNIGLDGIEVYNNMGWPLEIEFLRRLAVELDLVVTAGSDFHGIETGIEIGKGREGIRFDRNLLAPLTARIREQRGKNSL